MMLAVAERTRTWMADAACHSSGIDFFSEVESDVEAAKTICAGCPVRDECLAYAYSHGECEGVWGGTTPVERGMAQPVDVSCLGCGGALITVSETREQCLDCGSIWWRNAPD